MSSIAYLVSSLEQYVKVAIVKEDIEFLNTSGTMESISTILPGDVKK